MSLVALACVLFGIGLYGTLTRREVVAVLVSIEVMLGGPLVLLVGLGASVRQTAQPAVSIEGVGLLLVVVAAAEAAVGLALLVSLARRGESTMVEDLTEVKG